MSGSEAKSLRRVIVERGCELLEDDRSELRELERPGRGARIDVQHAVPGDAGRPGVPRHLLADRGRPGGHDRRHRARGAEPAQLLLEAVPEPFHQATRTRPGLTSSSWSGSPGSAPRRGRRDEHLRAAANSLHERCSAVSVELGEHVVEEEQRRNASPLRQQLRLREQQREQRHPLLALGAVRPQLPLACGDSHLVVVRAGAREAPLEIGREARREHLCGDGRGVVHETCPGEAELAGALGETRRLERRRSRPTLAAASACPASTTRASHGSTVSTPDDPGRGAPQRGVSLRDRLCVLAGQRGTRGEQPAGHTVDVRAADGGPGLHDGEAVGREHERRGGRAYTLERLGRGAVDLRALPFAGPKRDLEGDLSALPAALCTHVEPVGCHGARGSRPAGSAGEKPCVATCSDSRRFVLPAPFGPGREHEPRLQREIQGGVRAEVAKCEARDDQSGSRMGMIR